MTNIDDKRKEIITPEYKGYANNSCELSYQILCLLMDYMKYNGKTPYKINDILGAVESTKLEFSKKIVEIPTNKNAFEMLQMRWQYAMLRRESG